MTAPAGVHSRSILAGYEPARLQAAKVLVVGLGALGQNLVQNLALLGIGHLMLVDFDVFEGHNATRSPFYPTPDEAAQLGTGKAAIVAHRAVQVSTASGAEVYYAHSTIQALGDGALSWADIVVAAVDNLNARAWLAERCRLLARPMVEGGFSGPDFNLSAFAAADGAACYRCSRPGRESSVSCTAYALAAERAQIVPAIQTSAAVVGGYQAERVVQLLHGQPSGLGYRSYGNVRQPTLRTALLTADDDCPGIHASATVIGTVRDLGAQPAVRDLLNAIFQQFGGGRIRLAEPVVATISCTTCKRYCLVQAGESSWLASPRCDGCGGPWPATKRELPDTAIELGSSDQLSEEMGGTSLDRIGLRAGACLAAMLRDGRSGLLRIDGEILICVDRAMPLVTSPRTVTRSHGAGAVPARP
jgi:molybdopterin/thiamine biosynthesis adenylyltransferase